MSEARGGVAARDNQAPGTWRGGFIGAACLFVLSGCSGGLDSEPLVEYSTEVNVQGSRPQTLTRQLREGTYLIEVRERDIDLRVGIEAGELRTELGDAYLRHGLHRLVVRLPAPAGVKFTLTSIDQRAWRGAAALRILRWPEPAAGAPPDERLLGFIALGKGNELVARPDKQAWDAAIAPLRQAAAHFANARDLRSLAQAEYQRGWVEFFLLYQPETARRTAEAAEQHFEAVDDELGVQRAAVLRAMAEFGVAATMSPEVPRARQRELLDRAVTRLETARAYFAAHGLVSEEIEAMNRRAIRPQILGDYDACAKIYEETLARALARHDRFFEAGISSNLAYVATRKGQMTRAKLLLERALPLIERDRNPDLYATIIGNLGHSLVALGEFDRALVLHSEALEMFSLRGDDGQVARELAALAAVHFRTGDVQRALTTVESALPLFEKSHDYVGQVGSLRLAGNAAAELGQHELALRYLRRAELQDRNGINIERTRVLIAGELRELGDLQGAERLLAPLLTTANEATRADVLAERARLRQAQERPREALADLREADSAYARLKLDFNRIDTSAALAMALLDAGDVEGAREAAERAIGIETRIRVNSANPEMRARFLSASYAPYEARIEAELAGAAVHEADAVWRAFRIAEGVRARSLTDHLAHGSHRLPRDEQAERLRETMTALQMDLERHTRRDGSGRNELLETRRLIDETRARLEARLLGGASVRADARLNIPESREDAQAALPEDLAVLAYFVGERRSHAWLLTRAELRHATLPGRHRLERLVSAFIAQQRVSARAARDPALDPVLGELLTGISSRRLLVLPDGPLHSLPFAAMPLPHGGPRDQLIDRFVISAAPSLALALRPPRPRDDRTLRVAVISDPVYTPDDRRLTVAVEERPNYRGGASRRLARLPYSAIEARAVVRAFEGADVIELAGFNATARRVIELPVDGLDVLHFATHAVTRRDAPEQSALFLSEYAADGSPLPEDRLTADDISRSGLRADVVVLSGCATGDGHELRGEGVLGLTYGFLANGSSTVIASLWPVEDALTARFMQEFYTAYRASGHAAEALRTAQLRSRGAGTSAVWSSFVVRASELP